jgi:hypothetical protein
METSQLDELNTYWMQQVNAWKASGLPQTTFCKKHDLIYHRFIYWKLKFEGTPQPSPSVTQGSEFVKVLSRPFGFQQASGLTLNFPNGMTLDGLSDTNLDLACQLIKQLS